MQLRGASRCHMHRRRLCTCASFRRCLQRVLRRHCLLGYARSCRTTWMKSFARILAPIIDLGSNSHFRLFEYENNKNQSLQEKNPTFQNLGLIFRPKNQNFPFPTCPRHTTSPIFGPPCPNFLDPLPHSLKIAPAVLLASCAWDADGEIDEEDEEEHNNTKKRQRLLLAATLRRRAAASSHGRQPGQPGFLLSGERV